MTACELLKLIGKRKATTQESPFPSSSCSVRRVVDWLPAVALFFDEYHRLGGVVSCLLVEILIAVQYK